MFQTEFEFQLPKGYLDENGELHRSGQMRLATAKDELDAMSHVKVRANMDYAPFVLLSYVITRLGPYNEVSTDIIEKFYTSDLAYLQDFYQHINENGSYEIRVTCPHCGQSFVDTLNFHSEE